MSNAFNHPQVISLCADARLLENLKECNKLLEQVNFAFSKLLVFTNTHLPKNVDMYNNTKDIFYFDILMKEYARDVNF